MFRKLVCILLLVFGLMASQVSAATLHAFLVGYCDSDLGSEKDIVAWHERLAQIALWSGLEYDDRLFVYEHFNAELVMEHIKGLEVGPDDVVIFYFSGHGCRSMIEPTPWPILGFENKGLRGAEVIEHLHNKQARLNLIFFDCCNTLNSPFNMPLIYHFGAVRANLEVQLRDGLKRLFMDTAGTYAMTAAEPGLAAWGSRAVGGKFTSTLIHAMDQGAIKHLGWDEILGWTQKMLQHQKPVFHIHAKEMALRPEISSKAAVQRFACFTQRVASLLTAWVGYPSPKETT